MTAKYEMSLIGSAITLEGQGVESLELPSKAFSNRECLLIWQDILKGTTDAVSLAEAHDEMLLKECILSSSPSAIKNYAEIIIKAHQVRLLELEFSKALSKVGNGCSIEEAVGGITIAQTEKTSYKAIGEASAKVYESMSNRGNEESSRFINTGFTKFDEKLGGLERGNLVIIAARPSMGKSAILMDMCANIAVKHNVLFNSIEMDDVSIAYRAISSKAGLNLMSLRTETEFPTEVWRKTSDAAMSMGNLKLFIDDNADMSASKICARSEAFNRHTHVDVLAIDYIGLLSSEDTSRRRHEDISTMTRMLKKLAKKLNCVVILLSQLNREAEGVRPSCAHLRESGSIEQDADMIIFPYRHEKGKSLIEDALLIIGKNRNGPIGDIEVLFETKCASFRNK